MAIDLDPLDITKAIRLPADLQYRRGEPNIKRQKNGSVREYSPFRMGHWSMSSQGWVESTKLEIHLIWLLDQLEPVANQVLALEVEGLAVDFFCF